MENKTNNPAKIYLLSMMTYWLLFGLITIFYPKMMDLFQSEAGVQAKTAFSDHVWGHDGFDILALCILLFALSREAVVSKNMLWATTLAALMASLAIAYSLISTSYWNPLFIVAGLGCFSFVVWGYMLVRRRR